MIRVGSMQSNDLLIEYSDSRNEFQLINTVRVLEDQIVTAGITGILKEQNVDTRKLKIFFCGANEWVIRARGKALAEALKEGEIKYGA
ncbi:MAG TPA: hypothetical protein VHP38_02535 [Ruminiclostridium sp.]|nr:hypothetical protein [Ruminiclostridium sp.]